jgi:hypothetical protein
MKVRKFVGIAAFLIASSTLGIAQTGTTPKPSTAPKQGETPKQDAKPVPAAAPTAKPTVKVDLELPIQGLTQENAPKLKTALEGLQTEVYTCAGCKAEAAKAGNCPACKTPMVASKKPLFARVSPAADLSKISVQSHEGMQLKLSEIERALAASSVKLDAQKMTIPGNATLIIASATTAEQATAIQKALEESKLFQRVHATVDESTKKTAVEVVSGPTAPTRAKVDEAIAKAGATNKIEDVIWNDWSSHAGTK